METPVREYTIKLDDSGTNAYSNRLLVATPTTGTVRMEWAVARYGQIIPVNWGMVSMLQWMGGYVPLRYPVDNAQNLIVKALLEGDYEWLLLIEHDNILPPDAFIRFNEHIRAAKYPVVSGLYYTKSEPSEPLVFRGRGTSFYPDWEFGDLVWVDGVPTGVLLVHHSVLRVMWDEAEEYQIGNQFARRVFDTPRRLWFDPSSQQYHTNVGTSDLQWCTDVIQGDYLRKAGWTEHADAHPRWPFLIDTNIFCKHIDPDGRQYPPFDFVTVPTETPPDLGISVSETIETEDKMR
jgi:hypothetical protein